MQQRADAVVTGFVRSPVVLAQSLEPLRRLKREGLLRNIFYVTWDTNALDPFVAPAAAMPDVSLVRLPQPAVEGTGNQRGVVYQIRSLEAALSLVDDEDAIVLKLRPDFVADTDFLRSKIVNFETLCAVCDADRACGVEMPAPRLHNKIWIPWADANQPFFFEDAAFLGRKRDLRHLVTELTPEDGAVLGQPGCTLFAHVVRYARIFLADYPLFKSYVRRFPYFVNDLEYRRRLVPEMLNDGFFWHALIANAWILHSQFHVDIGEPGTLTFYANAINAGADWSNAKGLTNASPYDDVRGWRERAVPGAVMGCVVQPYGRLMDDAWQRGIFTGALRDFPRPTLTKMLENIAGSGDGRLRGIEDAFYRKIGALHGRYWSERNREVA